MAEDLIKAEVRMISGCRDSQTSGSFYTMQRNNQKRSLPLMYWLDLFVLLEYIFDCSADVSNVASFQLPDPAGRAGGACTSAMLKVLYAEHHAPEEDKSIQEVLLQMRDILRSSGFTQVPQLSSSRQLDIHNPFRLVPENFSGTRRALVIAINYVGQQGELRGCQNDAHNMVRCHNTSCWADKQSDLQKGVVLFIPTILAPTDWVH